MEAEKIKLEIDSLKVQQKIAELDLIQASSSSGNSQGSQEWEDLDDDASLEEPTAPKELSVKIKFQTEKNKKQYKQVLVEASK